MPFSIQVYIVRGKGFTTADVDPNLLNLEARKKGKFLLILQLRIYHTWTYRLTTESPE